MSRAGRDDTRAGRSVPACPVLSYGMRGAGLFRTLPALVAGMTRGQERPV
jgi:hypothetical protein